MQHKTERGPGVSGGWDLALVIDCTKEQHKLLQELIMPNLAWEDRPSNRPDLGK
jgi:hypothetical protein